MTRDEAIMLIREKQPYLAAEFGVRRVGLFGSYARGQAGAASDVDLLVEFERPIGFRFVEFVDFLEKLLGRRVDVLTPAGVQNIRVETIANSISQSIEYV